METKSVLNIVKTFIGLTEDYTEFDEQIKLCINESINELSQLNVRPDYDFSIIDGTETFEDYFSTDLLKKTSGLITSFVCLSSRMLFDPPSNGTLNKCYSDKIEELKSRILYVVDKEVEDNGDVHGAS